MKKVMSDYFSFSKKERIAVVILVVLIAGFIALPYFFGVKKKPSPIDPQLQQQISSLQADKPKTYSNTNNENTTWQKPEYAASNTTSTKFETFNFDPNTLDEACWVRLGIREKTAATIVKYRSKGGKFKTPEDLRKIWGLRKEEADRIIPYAQIATIQTNKQPTAYTNNNYSAPAKYTPAIIDINTATAQDIGKLPGIDRSLPYRIVNFRNKLGGFTSVQQVRETWGMTDSVFTSILPYLKVNTASIVKLNINTASEAELNAHPYIDKYTAKAIAAHRTQHGNFQSLNDLKKVANITDAIFNKISSYLSAQ